MTEICTEYLKSTKIISMLCAAVSQISTLNCLKKHTFIILAQFLWVRNTSMTYLGPLLTVFHKAAIKVSTRADISSENVAGEGSTSKLLWLLTTISSLLAVSWRLLLVPCHVGLSMRQLTTQQLASSKSPKERVC